MIPEITPRAEVTASNGVLMTRGMGFGLAILLFGSGAWHYLFIADRTLGAVLAGVGLLLFTVFLAGMIWMITRQEAPERGGIVVTDREIVEQAPSQARIRREEVTSVQFVPKPQHPLLGPLTLLLRPVLTVEGAGRAIRFSSGGDFAWAVDLVRAWVRENPSLAADEITHRLMNAPDHSPLALERPPSRWGWLLWAGAAITFGCSLLGWLVERLTG